MKPWLWVGFLAAVSWLYTAVNFRGLENHPGYYGNSYQAIHPGSFPNDPFMTPTRPTMLSLFYGLAKLFGEVWLDDRLIFFMYLGLVVMALCAVDKTARLLGADRFLERLTLLSFMALGHSMGLSNHALVVNETEFNATTLAGPVGLWTLYVALSGKRLRVVAGWLLLLWIISMKAAWVPTLMVGAILFLDRVPRKKKPLVIGAGVLLTAVAFLIYRLFLHPDVAADALLFDDLHFNYDTTEADPFMDPWWGNFYFFAISMAGLWLGKSRSAPWRRVGVCAGAGLAVWALGGLYLNFSPDLLKIPAFLPFNFTRGLWWPQYILFLSIGVFSLKRIQHSPATRGFFFALAAFLILDLTPFRFKRFFVLGLLLIVPWLVQAVRRGWKQIVPHRSRLRIVAAAVCLSSLIALSSTAFSQRRHFIFLAKHGVMGDNPSSKWIGINEYVREHTRSSDRVLALSMRDYYWRPERLIYDGSLRVRAGRSMPVGPCYVFYFDYDKLQWAKYLGWLVGEHFVDRWKAHDSEGVLRVLKQVGMPELLVVPTDKAQWLPVAAAWPYEPETTIRDFTILRKKAAAA